MYKIGPLVKEYANHLDKTSFAIQTTVESVDCEDSRFIEQPTIPISLEFPKIHILLFGQFLLWQFGYCSKEF